MPNEIIKSIQQCEVQRIGFQKHPNFEFLNVQVPLSPKIVGLLDTKDQIVLKFGVQSQKTIKKIEVSVMENETVFKFSKQSFKGHNLIKHFS